MYVCVCFSFIFLSNLAIFIIECIFFISSPVICGWPWNISLSTCHYHRINKQKRNYFRTILENFPSNSTLSISFGANYFFNLGWCCWQSAKYCNFINEWKTADETISQIIQHFCYWIISIWNKQTNEWTAFKNKPGMDRFLCYDKFDSISNNPHHYPDAV